MKYLLIPIYYGAIAVPVDHAYIFNAIIFGETDGFGDQMTFREKTRPVALEIRDLPSLTDSIGSSTPH